MWAPSTSASSPMRSPSRIMAEKPALRKIGAGSHSGHSSGLAEPNPKPTRGGPLPPYRLSHVWWAVTARILERARPGQRLSSSKRPFRPVDSCTQRAVLCSGDLRTGEWVCRGASGAPRAANKHFDKIGASPAARAKLPRRRLTRHSCVPSERPARFMLMAT